MEAISIRRINEKGGNAAAYEVKLPTKTIVLKTNVRRDSDNLGYEYQAGLYLNKIGGMFVRTHGLFASPTRGPLTLDLVRHLKTIQPETEMCSPSQRRFLAIEYVQGLNCYEHFQNNPRRFSLRLPAILYRIYKELDRIKTEFTHYDLNLGNILFHPESLIPRVIDYGRCHFPDSALIQETVCKTCVQCGLESGYWFPPEGGSMPDSQDFYINPGSTNQSHDLMYLHRLHLSFGSVIRQWNPSLADLLERVVYEAKTGTPERQSDGLGICNVTDAAEALKRMAQRRTRASAPSRSRASPKRACPKTRRSSRPWAGSRPGRQASSRLH